MGKYEPLARFLASRKDDSWSASFDEISQVLGFPLPQSAGIHRAWWSNQRNRGHSQAEGWQAAGWQTGTVDLPGRTVRFIRSRAVGGTDLPKVAGTAQWHEAMSISGITAPDELVEAALTALIRQEAAKALIAAGGSDSAAWVTPRERAGT